MSEQVDKTPGRSAWRPVGYLALAVIAWILTLALAKVGADAIWDGAVAPTAVAVALNVLAGILVIVANARLIRSQDELQRKIALDALAVSFGLSLVLGFAYVVAHGAGVIPYDLELVWFLTAAGALYAVCSVVSWLRYRW